MEHTFSLSKMNDRYALRIHQHNPLGIRDMWEAYHLDADELQSLRDVIGVNGSRDDIAEWMNKVERRLDSLELSRLAYSNRLDAVESEQDLMAANLLALEKNYDLMEFINKVMKNREEYEQDRKNEVDRQRGRSTPQARRD